MTELFIAIAYFLLGAFTFGVYLSSDPDEDCITAGALLAALLLWPLIVATILGVVVSNLFYPKNKQEE